MENSQGDIVAIGAAEGVLAAIHGTGAIDVPRPFSEPILLVDCTRIACMGDAATSDLDHILFPAGERLTLIREPSNLHDRWAIAVGDAQGRRLGYVGAECNKILARLMDAGKQLYGVSLGAAFLGRITRIEMEVYLDD